MSPVKADITLYAKWSEIKEPANEVPVNEEPTNEEPVNEEPTNEEPTNEEPVNEEPTGTPDETSDLENKEEQPPQQDDSMELPTEGQTESGPSTPPVNGQQPAGTNPGTAQGTNPGTTPNAPSANPQTSDNTDTNRQNMYDIGDAFTSGSISFFETVDYIYAYKHNTVPAVGQQIHYFTVTAAN